MNESHHRISEPRFTLQGPSPLAGHPLGLTSVLPRLEPQTDLLRLPTSVTTVNSCYSPVFIPDRRRNTNGTDDGSADGRPGRRGSRRRRPDQRGCGRPPRGCRRLGVPRKNSGRHDSAIMRTYGKCPHNTLSGIWKQAHCPLRRVECSRDP